MFGVVALFAAPFGCGARTELGGGIALDEDVKDANAEACQPPMTVYGGPFLDVCVPPHDASAHDGFVMPDVSAADDAPQDVTIVPPYGAHYPDDDR
jgi:hypothetical protein